MEGYIYIYVFLFLFFLIRTGAHAVTKAGFGKGSGRIFFSYLRCAGNETSILQCRRGSSPACSHSEDVGVMCEMGKSDIVIL